MRLDGERRLSHCLPNMNTFVPNHRSQCLYCVFPIMRCAFGAHLDVGLAERRTPCRFVGNLMFPSLFLGEDGHRWRDGIAQGHIPRLFLWVQSRFTLLQPCTAFSTTPHIMESANSFFFFGILVCQRSSWDCWGRLGISDFGMSFDAWVIVVVPKVYEI